MVEKCNAAGVRVYIDAVINHMAGVDSGTGTGSAGSYYNTQVITTPAVLLLLDCVRGILCSVLTPYNKCISKSSFDHEMTIKMIDF